MKKFSFIFVIIFAMLLTIGLVGCGGTTYSEEESSFISITQVVENASKLTHSGSSSQSYTKTGTPNFTVPANGYDGSAVTIKFYHTMGQNLNKVLDLYIADFNKLYPNIKVEWEQVGGYDDVRDQISTEISVGNQPNIAYCYPDHVALYNLAGVVAHLDNLIESTIEVTRADGSKEQLGLTQDQIDDFIEGYYNEGRQFGDGLMYTMPFSKSTEVLYYNKTFFDAHDIAVPDHWFATDENDKTSLEYVCKQIKAIDPECVPLGYDSEANWFITMCEQCGSAYTSATGNHYLFNNETNRSVMLEFRKWYQDGLLTTQKLYGAYTSGLFTAETGTKSYMSIGSSAGATHQRPAKVNNEYPFEVGIASIPQMNQNYKRVISQGPNVCIFNKANPQEVVASWLFVKFLTTSVEFQAEFSMVSGYVPVLKSVGSNAVYAKFLADADGYEYVAALSAKVCLEQEEAYYTSPAFNGSSVARDQVGALLAKVLSTASDNDKELIIKSFKESVDKCKYLG